MKKIVPLLLAVFIFYSSGKSLGQSGNLIFAAKLTGDQEVPAVSSSGYGVASFVLNATRDTMCIKVSVRNVSSIITGAHIHSGTFGFPGPVVLDLTSNLNGNNISAIVTGATLSDAMIDDLLWRRLYINVHTTDFPDGEVRGQIELETDFGFKSVLEGGAVVPAVSTPAIGVAAVTLKDDYMFCVVNAQLNGLSGPITSARLHLAGAGVNGPEVANLDAFISGTTIRAEVVDTGFVYDLIGNGVYLLVSTAAHPDGEVRGQIMLEGDFTFEVSLDGNQEVPATGSNATGAGTISFSPYMDSAYYDVVFDGLSAAPVSAHFHNGAPGTPGPVAVDLTSSISGNRIFGMATGITPQFVTDCLKGNIYINIHTPQYPDGEIRGQVRRNAYEGFTFSIDGTQEVPATTSGATGSGFLSIDPQRRNAHFRMVVNDLSGPLVSAHFHQGAPGVPGNIIFDLTPYFSLSSTSVSASNYWTELNLSTPFDSSFAGMFFDNDVYVNFHTAMYASGEARGDVTRGGDCFITTQIAAVDGTGDWKVYPVPASKDVTVGFTSPTGGSGWLELLDLSGRQLFVEPVAYLNGENQFSIPVSGTAPGVYVLKATMKDGYSHSYRIIKAKQD